MRIKKLNWNSYFLVIALATIAGLSNTNFNLLFGGLFGFIGGVILGVFILMN